MPIDVRTEAARYYDLCPTTPNEDIPFYRECLPSPDARVLELGCGTGRVLIPLAENCAFILGVDSSEAMIALCQEKLATAGIPASRASIQTEDITKLQLDQTFDLILAPFRVFQCLETDAEVARFFAGVRQHFAPGGTCILNVFRPKLDAETLLKEWGQEEEILNWENDTSEGHVTCHVRKKRVQPHPLVVYPDLVYRRHQGTVLMDEVVLPIAMRCYYAQEFLELIEGHGFHILDRWGGYLGETYDEGPELVVQFAVPE